jgi:hexokinase
MVVNTEWGGFNNSVRHAFKAKKKSAKNYPQRSHLPSTASDNSLDRLSINPRYQAFEKFISGMYLGEITRGVITALIDASPKPLLFNGKSTPAINKHYGIDTSFISAVEYAWLGDNSYSDSIDLLPTEFENDVFSADVKTRLESVRRAMVKDLGFKEDQVSLKDAAVHFLPTLPLLCPFYDADLSCVTDYSLAL